MKEILKPFRGVKVNYIILLFFAAVFHFSIVALAFDNFVFPLALRGNMIFRILYRLKSVAVIYLMVGIFAYPYQKCVQITKKYSNLNYDQYQRQQIIDELSYLRQNQNRSVISMLGIWIKNLGQFIVSPAILIKNIIDLNRA